MHADVLTMLMTGRVVLESFMQAPVSGCLDMRVR